MKKLLFTLLLLTTTAFAQNAQIERHLEQIEAHTDSVRLLLIGDPITDFDVEIQSDNLFKVEWLAQKQGIADIQYGTGDFQYSYAANVDEIPLEWNTVTIGVGRQGTWQFRLVSGNFLSDTVYVSNKDVTIPEPTIPEYDLLITLWDSWSVNYDFFDAVKLRRWNDFDEQYDKNKTVIISASHTWSEDVNGNLVLEPEFKWRQRLKRLSEIVDGKDPERYLIFLQDEPLIKDRWDLTSLNRLIELAKEMLPADAKIGMSFTNGSVFRRELPKGLDFYVTPNYPFKTELAIEEGHKRVETKQEFDQDIDITISQLRNQIGGADIYVIGQGFYNTGDKNDRPHERRWGKPPLEYPSWLYEAASRNGLKGVWWWVHTIQRQNITGLGDMPEYFKEIQNISN